MKFTNEQVGELVARFSECFKALKKLRRGAAADDYYDRQGVYDAALSALTRELNAVLPSEFTAFDRDREAQERAKKDPWRDGYPPWSPPEQKDGR